MTRVCLCALLALFVSVHSLSLSEETTRTSYSKEILRKPRCGVMDDDGDDDGNNTSLSTRRRRYVVSPSGGWKKTHLTYKFLNGPSNYVSGPPSQVEELFAAALAVWAPETGLTLTKIEQGEPDINVGFYKKEHVNCKHSFDGKNAMLAHANLPFHDRPLKIHFDDDEIWLGPNDNREEGIRFYDVAVHEIGHLLGLKHTEVKRTVMYPWYNEITELTEDDISAIRVLYPNANRNHYTPARSHYTTGYPPRTYTTGHPTRTYTTQHPPPDHYSTESARDSSPDFCYCNYDTIQELIGNTYGFKDQWVWVYNRGVKLEGYPKRLQDVFINLPNIRGVSAAYQTRTGNIALFSGTSIYEFDRNLEWRTTNDLSRHYGLPSSTRELQAVFLSNEDHKTYLFEQNQYWRYDERIGRMDAGYPKPMPNPINSAMVSGGYTFFFSGCGWWYASQDSSGGFIPDMPKLREVYDVTTQFMMRCVLEA